MGKYHIVSFESAVLILLHGAGGGCIISIPNFFGTDTLTIATIVPYGFAAKFYFHGLSLGLAVVLDSNPYIMSIKTCHPFMIKTCILPSPHGHEGLTFCIQFLINYLQVALLSKS